MALIAIENYVDARIDVLVPRRELLPGVPVSFAPQVELTLVTKSGGFGTQNTLVEIGRLCT